MENVLQVAAYTSERYQKEYGQQISEMKLHKLLYFSQRESLIQTDQPLFNATFFGWKYGPVLKEIRGAYRDGLLSTPIPKNVEQRIAPVIDKVFSDYAAKDAWSLSRLTHGEISWKNSREGISQGEIGDKAICIEDIRKDALRVKERRAMLNQYGLL